VRVHYTNFVTASSTSLRRVISRKSGLPSLSSTSAYARLMLALKVKYFKILVDFDKDEMTGTRESFR